MGSLFCHYLLRPSFSVASLIFQARIQLIISLVTRFGGELNDGMLSAAVSPRMWPTLSELIDIISLLLLALLEFILSDLRGHFDLAVAWLFAEYCVEEGYVATAQNLMHYDSCLTGLLHGAREKLDNRDRYG